MSLFPAYTELNNKIPENEETSKIQSFSSFKLDVPLTTKIDDNGIELTKSQTNLNTGSNKNENQTCKRKVKKKHKNKHKRSRTELQDEFESNDFIMDKLGERVFLKVNTISRPAVPKYKCMNSILGHLEWKPKRKKVNRYYNSKYLEPIRSNTEVEATKDVETEDGVCQQNAFYNQALGKDPFDVELWLQYVRFQDTVWKYEKLYKKGSIAKGHRVTAERKLSILDKAAIHNPHSDILTRERVLIAESIYPVDELSNYLKSFVEKNPSNTILWQGFIEATQCSMASCTTTSIISKYNQSLTKLHQLRRVSALEKSFLEERILSMLYQCGLFLRQTGLWEQLWTLLQLYLELNLSSLTIQTTQFDEKQLIALEEVIIDSQLPLHELWLRIEKLRESCHWLPWKRSELCEDPQRVIFIDDVADLIHPITAPGNSFRLTVTILSLLKVPLLPYRHSTIKDLGLDYVPWSLDTIETIYAAFFPVYLVDLQNDYLLKDANKLVVGPQYLKTHPGQEEYLKFVIDLMKSCAQMLQSTERIALFLWWLRFERFLVILDKQKRFKMPPGRNKKTKSAIKEFLKDDANRNNVFLYREYALFEYELGNLETATKILSTAIEMQSNGNSVVSLLNIEDRTKLCSLYRTLIELYLDTNKTLVIKYLIALVFGPNSETEIIEALDRYKQIVTDLLQEAQCNVTISDHFLPDYITDIIICYGWCLYLSKTPFEAGTVIENVLKQMEERSHNVWRREVLMEWYVTMIYKTCTEQRGCGIYGLFNDILHRSLKLFPNNLYFLAITCKDQSTFGCVGPSWWKLNSILSSSGHAMPALFLVIIANQQLSKNQDEWDKFDIDYPTATLTTYKNRILSLFVRLTQAGMCTKRCGLLWRLYLEHMHAFTNSEECRKVYYAAVEECPWLKALYIDAAIYIPAELPQIQDLIIEKQLRMHVTPEELEILRT